MTEQPKTFIANENMELPTRGQGGGGDSGDGTSPDGDG